MDSRTLTAETVRFGRHGTARLVRCPARSSPDAVVGTLGLPVGRPVIAVNGGTADLDADAERLLADAFTAVVTAAVAERATLVTGGTDAGVFRVLGQALARRTGEYRCVGVAPVGRTTWPGRRDPADPRTDEVVPLEPHHTHFVVVDGDEWGNETALMLGLVAALTREAPSVAVLAGGGSIAASELDGHLRAGRPVVVLAGSGRLADEVAVDSDAGGATPWWGGLVDRDLVEVSDVSRDAAQLAGRLREYIRERR